MLAIMLWIFHGVALLWNLNRFRPRIALLHGLAVAVVGAAMIYLHAPEWAFYVAGALIGAVAGWGHPLFPGLWPGLGILLTLPFLLRMGSAFLSGGAFALAAILVAALTSFIKGAI